MNSSSKGKDERYRKMSRDLMNSFIRMVNKYKAMEKYPVEYGTGIPFYHSERHMLDIFGEYPDLNITDLAAKAGVTKGAISQLVGKLEKKGAVERYKDVDGKQVRIRLTDLGREITAAHREVNEHTIGQLYEVIRDRPGEQVGYLMEVFSWIEGHLDEGLEMMKGKHVK